MKRLLHKFLQGALIVQKKASCTSLGWGCGSAGYNLVRFLPPRAPCVVPLLFRPICFLDGSFVVFDTPLSYVFTHHTKCPAQQCLRRFRRLPWVEVDQVDTL